MGPARAGGLSDSANPHGGLVYLMLRTPAAPVNVDPGAPSNTLSTTFTPPRERGHLGGSIAVGVNAVPTRRLPHSRHCSSAGPPTGTNRYPQSRHSHTFWQVR